MFKRFSLMNSSFVACIDFLISFSCLCFLEVHKEDFVVFDFFEHVYNHSFELFIFLSEIPPHYCGMSRL